MMNASVAICCIYDHKCCCYQSYIGGSSKIDTRDFCHFYNRLMTMTPVLSWYHQTWWWCWWLIINNNNALYQVPSPLSPLTHQLRPRALNHMGLLSHSKSVGDSYWTCPLRNEYTRAIMIINNNNNNNRTWVGSAVRKQSIYLACIMYMR